MTISVVRRLLSGSSTITMVNSFFQCVQLARREHLGLCSFTLNSHLSCIVAERADAFCGGCVHEFFVFGLTGHFHGDESGDDTSNQTHSPGGDIRVRNIVEEAAEISPPAMPIIAAQRTPAKAGPRRSVGNTSLAMILH